MDADRIINETLRAETDRLKDSINEYCSNGSRCVDPDARHVIKSQWICLYDVRESDELEKKLRSVFEDLREKVFQSGYFAAKCIWSNIPDSEHNPDGIHGQFIVTLA